jgi:hypothetical protein
LECCNSGEPPRLMINNDGLIKAHIEMQVPKGDHRTIVDVVFQLRERDGAFEFSSAVNSQIKRKEVKR